MDGPFNKDNPPVAGKSRGTVAAVRRVAQGNAFASVLTRRGLTRNVQRAAVAARPALLTLTLERAASVVARGPIFTRRIFLAFVDVQSTGGA